jgi:hypothetical protein
MTRFAVALVLVCGSSLVADEPALIDEAARIEEKLDAPAEMHYLDTPLGDVVTDLELRHKFNIELDVVPLAEAGIASDLEMSKVLKGLPLATALDLLLGDYGMTWAVHHDVLLITTAKNETKYLQTKVYAVGDLEESPEAVGNMIAVSLAPDTWRSKEGKVGSIVPLAKSNSLVITHTSRMHRQIAKLLDDVREAKKPAKK